MNPLLEYIKAQKPELAEVITALDTIQSQKEETQETPIEVTHDVVNTDDLNVEEFSLKDQTQVLKAQVLKLKRMVKFLKQEVINEAEINNDFALAVGACSDCFGCDDDCEKCEGKGEPGFFVPDFVHYKELIVPAQKKYNLHFKNNKY
ncbi:hypothetical protein MBM09_00300 [Flaviramulus sp. BrNp1-15]|uniref:hypothetical protein n=1 Tax=Flaviramulus sp. BrNp1-15 TaxID=2916754 RepID=UPI001EE8F007|nr:hypothetical protein [Flaviramulus sp. BrNp1-15]ULC59436.1 hypothetical protein MBM09_00300 [Flaviramulus sp. BrNp1-15]